MPVFSSYSSSIRLLPILHTGVRTIFRIQFGGGMALDYYLMGSLSVSWLTTREIVIF